MKTAAEIEAFQLVTPGVTISLLSLLKNIYSVTGGVVTDRLDRGVEEIGLVTALDTVARAGLFNENRWRIVVYFIENGAATGFILKYKLRYKYKMTVYRAIEAMRELGLVEEGPAFKVPQSKKNTWTTPWVLTGYDEDTRIEVVKRATELHNKLMSPKYRLADAYGQTILERFDPDDHKREITYREIMELVKSRDIADMAAKIIHENGVKVWR